MAYPIKNTISATDSLPTINPLYYGVIGVNQGGYGKTSVTGFWNGKTPNVSGYVTHSGNGNSSPTMYISTGNTELIALANQLGGTAITTIGAAINYFNTTGNFACVNMDCPNIVTTNLFLYYDVGYTISYSKTGIYLYDISGLSSGWGLLVNGPTYNSANYGSIVLDGVNDYIQIGSIMNYTSGNFSFSYWVYVTSLTTNQVGQGPVIIYKGSYQVNGYYDQINTDGSVSFITNTAGSSVYSTTAAGIISAGNIYNISYTREGSSIRIYVNGVDVTATPGNHVNPVSTSNNFYIGSYGGTYIFSNVRIYSFANYDRALSGAEVLQNYYAGKKRFITKDKLRVWYDGENTNTRVITPVTAYDVSDSLSDASLINGTSLKHWDAGTSFYFDGVNDYINCGNILNLNEYTKIVIFKPSSLSFANNLVSGTGHYLYLAGTPYLRAGHYVSGVEAISSYTTIVNTWNFAAVTFDTTNGFKIYQNGNTVVGSNSSVVPPSATDVTLGTVSGSFLYQGQMGIVMLYNKALTSTEILDIYQAYKGRFGYA